MKGLSPASRAAARLLLCALALAGCDRTPTASTDAAPQTAAEEAPPESAEARFVPAESAQGSALFDGPARVLATPEGSAVVSAPLALRVTKIRVRPGQDVKQGEPLVDVVMPELIRAVGALQAADLRIKGYEARRARLLPLVQEGLARAADAADLEAQIALARADRESAHAVLRTAGVSDQAALGQVAETGSLALRAPITGVVVGVAARLGASWEPQNGPLVELAQAEGALVEARFQLLPPEGVGFVWQGSEAELPLTLVRVSPRALPEDGSRVVWLSSEARGLVPGQIGRVRAVPDAGWMVVPASALVRADGKVFVAVESASGRERAEVRVVRASSTEAVVSGLSATARVLAAQPKGAP